MKACEIYDKIMHGDADDILRFECAVPDDRLGEQRKRIGDAVKSFIDLYGDREAMLFSVGGRSEVSGNHTDHNNGRVLCAAVNLDIIAVAGKTEEGDKTVTVKSEGFERDTVREQDIFQPDAKKYFTSASLIAGVEKAFLERGLKVGGFVAYTTSNVFKGSGLSSSAAFEVMIGNIINHLYNCGSVDNVEIAKMAQFAENVYFGKPCGLMDQTACAVGGFIAIDFKNPASPSIKKLDYDLGGHGYSLCIVDTGGNHTDLNEDYASVPAEMKAVAALLNKNVLREVKRQEILDASQTIRAAAGDRALLRALHFLDENKRVEEQTKALEAGDTDAFLSNVRASGLSSFCFLQNVYSIKNVREQGLSLALCLTEACLRDTKAAWRVHGGGFAGTIQAFVPVDKVPEYKQFMESVFGDNTCHTLSVRRAGAFRIM